MNLFNDLLRRWVFPANSAGDLLFVFGVKANLLCFAGGFYRVFLAVHVIASEGIVMVKVTI